MDTLLLLKLGRYGVSPASWGSYPNVLEKH